MTNCSCSQGAKRVLLLLLLLLGLLLLHLWQALLLLVLLQRGVSTQQMTHLLLQWLREYLLLL
jgi:hypothetical protein